MGSAVQGVVMEEAVEGQQADGMAEEKKGKAASQREDAIVRGGREDRLLGNMTEE